MPTFYTKHLNPSLRGVSRGNPAFAIAQIWIAAALYQGLAMTYDGIYHFMEL